MRLIKRQPTVIVFRCCDLLFPLIMSLFTDDCEQAPSTGGSFDAWGALDCFSWQFPAAVENQQSNCIAAVEQTINEFTRRERGARRDFSIFVQQND